MNSLTLCLLSTVGTLAASGGPAPTRHSTPLLYHRPVGTESGRDGFGESVAPAGDVNGDGVQDLLAVGSKRRGGDPGDSRGRAFIFSGKDGALLVTLDPPSLPIKTTLENSGGADGITSVVGHLRPSKVDTAGTLVMETSDLELGTGWVLFMSAKDGRVLRSIQRGRPSIDGGNSHLLGDIDQDGTPDIGLFASFGWDSREEGTHEARVISGSTGKALRVLQLGDARTVGDYVHVMAGLGDLNGDGVPEIAAGASTASAGTLREAGRVDIYSGKDGVRLFRLEGKSSHEGFGASLCSPGDLNGDGTADFVVGARPNHGGVEPTPGEVVALSGKDRKPLWTYKGRERHDNVGMAMAAMGDVNRDKVSDLAVACGTTDDAQTRYRSKVILLSGKTGELLSTLKGEESVERHFGASLAACGDVDGDGVMDLAVGEPGDLSPGSVHIYSGKSWALIRTLRNP